MAWPDTRQPTDALTYEFVPQVWSSKVIDHVRANLVAAQVVNTAWKSELTIGDKVWIPVTTTMSTSTVNPATTAASVLVNATTGTDAEYIEITHWEESPVQLDDSVKRQSQVGNLLEIMASNAAYALEKSIDTDVCTLFAGLQTTYGSDGQTFTDDIYIYLMENLDEGDVPRIGRSLVGDPSMMADIYKIDKFIRLDYQNTQVVATGNIGLMYGTPVYITNNLVAPGTTGNTGALLHRDAIGLVIQDGPDVEKWRHHAAHADIINISAMWGEAELRDTFGLGFYTRKI